MAARVTFWLSVEPPELTPNDPPAILASKDGKMRSTVGMAGRPGG